jgi:hypothetical protein
MENACSYLALADAAMTERLRQTGADLRAKGKGMLAS